MNIDRQQLGIGVGVLALLVAIFAVVQAQSVSSAVDQLSVVTPEDVRSIAQELDNDQTSRHGEPLYAGEAMGYVVEFSNGESFYVTGDSGPTWEMANYIKPRLSPTVAFFSSGGVWTADMRTAGWEASLVDADISVPIHYGTFPVLAQDAQGFVDEVNRLRDAGETDTESRVIEVGEWEDVNGVRTMWIGHGSLLFEDPDGTRIAVDPWVQTNPKAPQAWKDDLSNMPRVDVILITHAHVDHYTPSLIRELQDMYNATVLTNWELSTHMANSGLSNVVGVNLGSHIDKAEMQTLGGSGGIDRVYDEFMVHTVPAAHTSSPATKMDEAFGLTLEGEIPQ